MCSAHFEAENRRLRAFQQLDAFSFAVDASHPRFDKEHY